MRLNNNISKNILDKKLLNILLYHCLVDKTH